MRITSLFAGMGLALAALCHGEEAARLTMPGPPLGIAWGFLYGYQGAKPEVFMPQVRGMGGGFTKVYLFWNQIEPEKGRFQWEAVDTFVKQLKSPEEGLIALFSTSAWGSRSGGTLLPPSPPKDPDAYYRFVHTLVAHCKGLVRYWQNDAEPNSPIYWAGTKEEFVAARKVFYKAVKDADPARWWWPAATTDCSTRRARIPFPGRRRASSSSTTL